jgi:transglutaminase-like putative cysteine protease
MRYLIDHQLSLAFHYPVREHHCELRLAPAETAIQRVQAVRVATEPAAPVGSYVDYFGNRVHHFSLIAPHDAVQVLLQADVETLLTNPFDYPIVKAAEERDWIRRALNATPQLWDYVLHRSDLVPEPARLSRPGLAWPAAAASGTVRDNVMGAAEWAATLLHFAPEAAPHASLEDALNDGTASCTDLAHLLIAAVRSWGVPARFARGYTDPALNEEAGGAARETAPRAWAEVLIPGAGWRGFDPVHQLVANDAYIVAAVGRDAAETVVCRSSFKGEDEADKQAASLRIKRAHDQ